MDPLREIPRVRQTLDSALQRRWFTCATADLFIWHHEGSIKKFELCYGKPRAERSLTWTATGGFIHSRIDDGEINPSRNQTPIAVPELSVDRAAVAIRVEPLMALIDPCTYRFVMRVLRLGH
ncbi:MAG: hypothetical protein GKR94_27360 [Gammaproteobacteria bacterium]|nr:hypothetical protein [Gammaproteobacteria bacterium]